MDISQARKLLLARGWLSHTPAAFSDAILARGILQTFKRGDPIYRLDGSAGGLVGLAEGAVQIEAVQPDFDPLVGDVQLPGTWLGGAAIITGNSRVVGIIALRDCTVLLVPAQDIHALIARDPAVWRWIALLSVINTRRAINISLDLMIRDPQARAAAVLLRLAGCREDQPEPVAPAEINSSQEDLARMINMSRTTLGDFLRAAEASGLIRQAYRKVHILDVSGLRGMLRPGDMNI